MDQVKLLSMLDKLSDSYEKQKIMIEVLFSHIKPEDRLKVLGEMYEQIENQSRSDDNAKDMQ